MSKLYENLHLTQIVIHVMLQQNSTDGLSLEHGQQVYEITFVKMSYVMFENNKILMRKLNFKCDFESCRILNQSTPQIVRGNDMMSYTFRYLFCKFFMRWYSCNMLRQQSAILWCPSGNRCLQDWLLFRFTNKTIRLHMPVS